jgi:hypothetical protein
MVEICRSCTMLPESSRFRGHNTQCTYGSALEVFHCLLVMRGRDPVLLEHPGRDAVISDEHENVVDHDMTPPRPYQPNQSAI